MMLRSSWFEVYLVPRGFVFVGCILHVWPWNQRHSFGRNFALKRCNTAIEHSILFYSSRRLRWRMSFFYARRMGSRAASFVLTPSWATTLSAVSSRSGNGIRQPNTLFWSIYAGLFMNTNAVCLGCMAGSEELLWRRTCRNYSVAAKLFSFRLGND